MRMKSPASQNFRLKETHAAFERIQSELQRMNENSISHAILKKFCPTRWTVRGASVTSIVNNYCALIELWEQSLETKLDSDVKGRIIGPNYEVSFSLWSPIV